jgi:3-hydroxyacyl-CoA dehydrogenase
MAVKYWREDDVFYVELANPPVNAINLATRDGLFAAITAMQSETRLSHIVLSGGQKIFAAGGDAREFDQPPLAPHLPDVLAMIEKSDVPWVAAINGAALGGGLELALACRYRIASHTAQLGLPEVTLGVVPGAGGTQRLPRLIGFAAALEMITNGKPIGAAAAQKLGLINAIDDNPQRHATAIDPEILRAQTRVSELQKPATDQAALASAEAMIAKRLRGQIAPKHAIELVKASCETDFDSCMAAERSTFLNLRQSQQARALRHVFFAERGAKAPADISSEPAPTVERAVVIGGGTMGAGIAHALLAVGIPTLTVEYHQQGAANAAKNAERLIEAGMKRGLISSSRAADIRSIHQISTNFADVADADIAIEAVFEDMEVKQQVFRQLDAVMPKSAVLATNTSYLDINQIATVLNDPSRLIGLHFFVPAHVMKLLEIVRGETSSPRSLATGFKLAKRLRKTPVLSGVCDGFIGNRILARYREAADTLLLEGAQVQQIDTAMTAFGYAMGLYQTQDMSGLDHAYANRRRQDATRDPARRYIAIADRIVEAGRLGQKTGAGWYCYEKTGTAQPDPFVDDLIIEEAVKAGIKRRSFSSDEISQRLVLAMINEAAAILDEGIAQNASDIDLVSVLGYGFPRWRGGLMHYAESLGSEAVLKALEILEKEDPIVWAPAAPIRNLCGRNFADIGKNE